MSERADHVIPVIVGQDENNIAPARPSDRSSRRRGEKLTK
jgi:hypothetical protein